MFGRTLRSAVTKCSLIGPHLQSCSPTLPYGFYAPNHLYRRSVTKASAFVTKLAPPSDVVEEEAKANYRIFYRFPHIRMARFVTRLKIFQTGVTVVMIPPAWHFYSAGLVGPNVCVATVATSMLASVMLYIMSGYLRRLVGLVAINNDETVVRLSCLNFWGKRRDLYVEPRDLVPLADLSDDATDVYLKLRRYSSEDVLYLTLKYGVVTNGELFRKVFGNVRNRPR